jgi:transposase-like protein
MEFPLVELLDERQSTSWVRDYFHPGGLRCPRCGSGVDESYQFRQTRRSHLTVYRCKHCHQVYNLYSRTIFEQSHLTPSQVVLLMRGVLQGETTQQLATELGVAYKTVHRLRLDIQSNARQWQAMTPLPDNVTESDEMFQNAGEKRRKASSSH